MSIFRSSIINPRSERQCDFIKDGGLVVNESGFIEAVGEFDDIIKGSRERIIEVSNGLITPSFSDMHVHMPQNHVRGQFEDKLLPWLKNCIWPEESKFDDQKFADEKADKFYRDMAKQGTLLSLVFSSIHENALHSIFKNEIGHTIAGNVLMDQNSPDYLTQNTQEAIEITKRSAQKYGDKYAVTPRFAPTCTMDLMKAVAKIAQKNNCWIQTHLSENPDEVKWVKELFPNCESYTDVYRQAGLLGLRTIMAHCIYMSDNELDLIKKTGTKIAHCPTSNIALGSGRMPVEKIKEYSIPFALASDVGAGPSLSMLHVMQKYMEQHKEAGVEIAPEDALYRATLAGAELLDKSDVTGNLDKGKEANFVIIKTSEKPKDTESAVKDITSGSIEELEQKVQATYLKGRKI
jgi:guanine deaminase